MFWLRKMKSVAMTSVQKGGLLFQRFFLVFIRFLKVARATWKCSSWQVLWRGWRRQKEAKGQRSPMRPSWESRKWSFLVLSCSFPPSPSSASWAPPRRSTTWWRWWRWCRPPLSGQGWSLWRTPSFSQDVVGWKKGFDQPLQCTLLRSLSRIWTTMLN